MFLSLKIDIKLSKFYKNSNIYIQLCKKVVDHIQQVRNQSDNDDIPEEPEKLKFAPIII